MLADRVEVRVGDVWRDLDPRGGPTFRVVEVDPPDLMPGRARVEGLDGKRPRSVLLDRFRDGTHYRSGYTLVSRAELPEEDRHGK